MKRKFDVYIAGAMHGRKVSEVLRERAIAKTLCKQWEMSYYDPAEDENLAGQKVVNLNPSLSTMLDYVEKDEENLDKCRSLLVLTGDKSSAGTAWEMARMFYKNKRPIACVAPLMHKGLLKNFTTIKVKYIRPTIVDALECLREVLK